MENKYYNRLTLELLKEYIEKYPEQPFYEIIRRYFGIEECPDNSVCSYYAAFVNRYDSFDEIPQYDPDTIFDKVANIGYERAKAIYDSWDDLVPKDVDQHDYYYESHDEKHRPLYEFFHSELLNEFYGLESFQDIRSQYQIGSMTDEEADALENLLAGTVFWDGVRQFVRDTYGVVLQSQGRW